MLVAAGRLAHRVGKQPCVPGKLPDKNDGAVACHLAACNYAVSQSRWFNKSSAERFVKTSNGTRSERLDSGRRRLRSHRRPPQTRVQHGRGTSQCMMIRMASHINTDMQTPSIMALTMQSRSRSRKVEYQSSSADDQLAWIAGFMSAFLSSSSLTYVNTLPDRSGPRTVSNLLHSRLIRHTVWVRRSLAWGLG